MKIHLMSDLHFDKYKQLPDEFVASIDPQGAEVLVLAGDVEESMDDVEIVTALYRAFLTKYPHVIHVPGNHEYWGSSPAKVAEALGAAAQATGVHAATEPGFIFVAGKTFACGTMWYPQPPSPKRRRRHERRDPLTELIAQGFPDYGYISNLAPWVYEQNADMMDLLTITDGDMVVVSHHLPSPLSSPERFRTSDWNHFFVCNVEDRIMDRQPVAWLHGHTHMPCQYSIGKTRVYCNPRGYLGEVDHGALGYQPLLLEV